jgi:hypothetical protein
MDGRITFPPLNKNDKFMRTLIYFIITFMFIIIEEDSVVVICAIQRYFVYVGKSKNLRPILVHFKSDVWITVKYGEHKQHGPSLICTYSSSHNIRIGLNNNLSFTALSYTCSSNVTASCENIILHVKY